MSCTKLPDFEKGMAIDMKKFNSFLIKLFGTVIIPAITFLVIVVLCYINGVHFFENTQDFKVFFKATAAVGLTTFALSINLNTGRFDFSIGSIALLSSVVSTTICLDRGFGYIQMLAFSIIFGLVLGIISGVVYVVVNLPPIIVSLGITLFYEGAAFAFTKGSGVSFATKTELTSFSSIRNYAIIIVIALILMIIIFDYTKFGYNYKALLSGQKVSVNTGVKEKRNAIICYAIAGALMGVVGVITYTQNGTIQMTLNFGSIAIMFTAFLPMFIGGFIGRFCNEKIGFLLGAVTTAFISLAYNKLSVSSSVQQVVTAVTLVVFLIYLNNEGKLKQILKRK